MEEESQLPEDGVMTSPARQVNLSVTVPRIDGLVSSVSVGQYLNKAEDFPDGIHKSQSINHLTSINETDRLYRKKEKRKKAARLSRGFLEFISLVDLAKPVEKEEKKRSTKDQSTPNLEVVTEPAESSSNISDESPVIRQRRPVERRERRTTVGTEAGLLGLHHSLSTKTGRKTTTPSINGDFSMSTPSLTLAGKTDIPPRSRPQTSKREAPVVPRVQAPPLPQWKSVLDTRIQMDVDTMFQNIMTDSDLYRAWIAERKSENIHNLNISDWKDEDGLVSRTVSFEVTKNFGITSANIKVNQIFRQSSFCVAGEIYGVDIDTTNSGIAYADSFIIHEHFRLTADGEKTTKLQVVTEQEFIKSTFLKSKIESEFWALYKKNMSLLEQMLENQVPQQEKPAKLKPKSAGKVAPSIDYQIEPSRSVSSPLEIDYSEMWRIMNSLIILLILSLMVMAIFKIAYTLETIESRLTTIERVFIPKE